MSTYTYNLIKDIAQHFGGVVSAVPAGKEWQKENLRFLFAPIFLTLFFLSAPHAHALTISGTLYSDEGSTVITTGKTIKMAVGTSTPATVYTTTSDGSGVWSFTVGTIDTVTPLTFWVDATTSIKASLFTKSSSTVNDITNLPLYKDHIIIRHEETSGTSTTNTDLAFYDYTHDTDILYDASTSTLGLTVMDQNQEFYIETGKNYAPGGATTISHLENRGTFTAPTTTLTVQGNFVNTGTFTNSGGNLILTGMGTYATGTLTGTSALNNVTVKGGGTDVVGVAYDSSAIEILSLVIDSTNGVLYAGTSNTGVIYRCVLSTNCDESGDFTIAIDTSDVQTFALTIDTTNGVLYAGTGNGGIIYRCLLSTGCDASGDFTTAYDTTETYIFALVIDSTNGVLYAGTGNGGIIYRCLLSTGCDASGDFTTAYDTTDLYIRSFTIDTSNGVLYAGSSANGIIYRCLLSTGCDASGDFTTAYDTAQGEIYSLTIDTTNSVLYASTDGGGIIYRCALSTGCDASGDFTTAYDTAETYINALTIDALNGILYAGSYPNGIIYRCLLSTGCDASTDFMNATDTSESQIYSLAIDSSTGVLYAGSSASGIIYRRSNDFTFGANASTSDLTITPTKRMTAPNQLTIGGDYINGGTFVHASGTIIMSSSTAHTIQGDTSENSAFYSIVIDNIGPVSYDQPSYELVGNLDLMIADTGTNVLYGTGYYNGILYRCALSTSCDSADDFTIATTTSAPSFFSIAIDTINDVLYAVGGDSIYRCALSTGCDSGADFTTYSSGQDEVRSLIVDTSNSVLYIGTGSNGIIYRCLLSTSCDSFSDFTIAYVTTSTSIYALTIDAKNGTLYAGSYYQGIIYRCALSTGCDAAGDFTNAYDTVEDDIHFFFVDTSSDVLYAAPTSWGAHQLYRCPLSTGCDASGDFTYEYDNNYLTTAIGIDQVNHILYVGHEDGSVYRCFLSSDCDTYIDFELVASLGSGATVIDSFFIDNTNEVFYIGSSDGTYRCSLSATCNTSTSTSLTNLTINSGSTFTQNIETRVNGEYINNGTSSIDKLLSTTTIVFTGATAQFISGNLTATSALPHLTFIGSGTKTFSSNASTSDFTISSGSTIVAPNQLTIGGTYTNSGTFTHNSGNITFTAMGGSATGTMTGTSAFNNVTVQGGGVDTFSTAYDSPESLIGSLIIDTTNGVLYAGSNSGGIIYRCVLSTNCDAAGDFTTAYDTTQTMIHSLVVDQVNGVLYAGTGNGGIIYRCALSTNCDAAGDFTTAYDTPESIIRELAVDSANGVLYAATAANGILYRCLLSTNCDAAGDFTTAYNSTESEVRTPVFDYTNGVMYIGSIDNGYVYRCLLSTNCDAAGDFTTAYDTPEIRIREMAIDTTNSVLYVGTADSGIIYRCALSTNCDAAGDFTTAYDTPETSIRAMRVDTINNILYVGTNPNGLIYRCDLSTNCDEAKDFVTARDSSATEIFEFMLDTTSGTLYAASDNAGIIYRRPNSLTFGNTASTTNLTISTGKQLISSSTIGLTGNYTNSGTFIHNFGTTTFRGTSQQTATGTMTGASAFKNIEITNTSGAGSSTQSVIFGAKASTTGNFNMYASTSAKFAAAATSTFQNIHLEGAATRYAWLRSSTPGTQFNFYVPGTQNLVNYVNVQDSNACPTTINATSTSVDAGNNTCWAFPVGYADLTSAANQIFTYNQATTTISTITITEESLAPSITAANDIRIVIATTSLNMRWDTTDTLVTLGGTASAKASTTVSYEADGAILVINVTSDFAAGETLTISGLSYAQFGTVGWSNTSLGVRVTGVGTTTQNTDDKIIQIAGTLTLSDHTLGQVPSALQGNSVSTTTLYAFKMTPQYEGFQIPSNQFTITGTQSMVNSDITNAYLYRDLNSDRQYDAGDVAVGGGGFVAIPSIFFIQSFNATTTQDYILVGSVSNLKPGDSFTINMTPGSATGFTSVGSVVLSGSAQTIQHIRPGMGSSGSSEVGGAAPQGQGVTTGGSNDGGETIGNEPGFNAPGSNGSPYGTWTTGANAYSSDGLYASTEGNNDSHSYGTFGFNVPSNNTVTGIEVKLEASVSQVGRAVFARLSWDGGTSVTSLQTTGTLTTTDAIYTLGGGSDTWGHTWTPAEIADGNFSLELLTNEPGNGDSVRVDALQIRVYHQSTGGGAGGGGAVYNGQSQYFANVYSAFSETWRGIIQKLFWWFTTK